MAMVLKRYEHEKSFPRNYQLAKQSAAETEAGKLSIRRGSSKPVTLREYAEKFRLPNHHGTVNTIRTNGQSLRLHLLPTWGDRNRAHLPNWPGIGVIEQ